MKEDIQNSSPTVMFRGTLWIKETVGVILSDTKYKEGKVLFTICLLKPLTVI